MPLENGAIRAPPLEGDGEDCKSSCELLSGSWEILHKHELSPVLLQEVKADSFSLSFVHAFLLLT